MYLIKLALNHFDFVSKFLDFVKNNPLCQHSQYSNHLVNLFKLLQAKTSKDSYCKLFTM